MSESKTPILSRLEFILIGMFFLAFIVWSVSKCSRSRSKYEDKAAQEIQDSLDYAQSVGEKTAVKKDTVAAPPVQAEPSRPQYSTLYVTIDGLNVRSTPGLKGQVLDRLALYDEVFFLNERTDSLYEFSIGKVKVKEPYVKIRTRKGRTGWVYGAGVHYYKMKRDGAE
jgi:hypothetical protein